MLGIFFPD